jgi:hypothetical protein
VEFEVYKDKAGKYRWRLKASQRPDRRVIRRVVRVTGERQISG